MKTKRECIDFFLKITEPVKNKYTHANTRLCPGTSAAWYEDISAGVEGFSRILWGLVPYIKGGGDPGEFKDIYLEGIKNGTDPQSEYYWGECHDGDQRFVEMAAMAYAILMVPEFIWEPLDKKTQDNFALWLYQINKYAVPENNWYFFVVLVNIALKSVNKIYSKKRLNECLEKIETFYVDKGWYFDGRTANRDYYVAFALHFYGLIYSMFVDDEYAKRYRQRAMEYAKSFAYWFDENGAAVPYGRSLTYRFAQCSFWSMLVLAGLKPYPLEVMKGIISRNLDYWDNQNIFDDSGVLTVGYAYGNMNMAENYNAPGSPYWSLKAMAILALDDDDPFWSVKEMPLLIADSIKAVDEANMIMAHQKGEALLYPVGSIQKQGDVGHVYSKYEKFVYSSRFGFSVPRSCANINDFAPDNVLAFEIDGYIFTKRGANDYIIKNDGLAVKWSPIKGIDVETAIIPFIGGHKRIHKIVTDYDCTLYDCGFAVAARDEDNVKCIEEDDFCIVQNDFSKCTVRGGKGFVINAAPNTNLLYNKTKIPSVRFELKKGAYVVETVVEEWTK